ncbi:MAG: nucleoside kinase [Bacilli bacterium]|nr:nucleoside kinase [Bacilli bacterium]
MIETVSVKINGKTYKYSKGITLLEIANEVEKDRKHPILLAKINNGYKELSSPITENCEVEFLDLSSREGNRCHVNGLVYMLVYAVKKLYGQKEDIIVQRSLDKGIYIETSFRLTETKLANIKECMKALIKADIPITKVTIDRLEAIKYFESIGDSSKAGVMNYNTNSYITLYRLGNSYNYFYSKMAPSTGKLKEFDLTYLTDNGFVLRFPTIYMPDKIKKYEHQANMFKVFQETRDWAKLINVKDIVDLNRIVSTGKISDLIKIDETLQSNRLLNIAKEINERKNKVKIVLIAGPSSSGKTTTTRKLCMYLQSFGLTPRVVSMDDYFVEKQDTPLDENGKPDYECLEAMDIKLFDKQMAALMSGEKVIMPTYNFALGKKEFKEEVQIGEKDILLIEGIHALDDKILTNIKRENKYKIYISALTELNMDTHNRICTSDNRLLRRIIRDNRTRDYRVEYTLQLWDSVRRGEEKYIFPFQGEADATINSASIYELGVIKTYAEPLLYSVPLESPYYEEAKRLINFLRLFLPIPADAIPEDAVVREFIGGSYFHD